MTPFARRFGQGPRPALALHCTLAHSRVWAGVGEALSDRLTITAMDLPSHGEAPDWVPPADQHAMSTEMAHRLLDQPMDVIGHSYGATVALRLAVERPEFVSTLTLIEPVFLAAAIKDEPDLLTAHEAEVADYSAAVAAGDDEAAARAFNRLWSDGPRWADLPERTRAYMTQRIHFVVGSKPFVFDDYLGYLSSGALEQLTMPVLLMQGERTLEIIDGVHRAMARRIPNAHRVTINGAGHMAPITHPEQVARAIRGLLDQVEEGRDQIVID